MIKLLDWLDDPVHTRRWMAIAQLLWHATEVVVLLWLIGKTL
jgi:hypothetical protein